jgi:sortase A
MISRILFLIGIVCLSLYGFFTVRAYYHQQSLEEQLDHPATATVPSPSITPPKTELRPRILRNGDLFGRLEVPRLNMSVMVMEGAEDEVLRLGAGHVPGTPLAIAGHRDTFFRPLKDIKPDDHIRFTTPEGTTEYRVVSTKIVGPYDTWVLDNQSPDTMTLITCYPFYYIGPAPKRFIVEAMKN